MKVAAREDVLAWLDRLAASGPGTGPTLIAPKAVGEQILYRPVRESSEIALSFGRTDLSAKEHFFPATDVLFTVVSDPNGLRIEEPPAKGEQVVFGLRPCDAKALRVLDALFIEQEPVDSYYAERRKATTLVGLACREMEESCFCTSLGSAPDDASDVDLLLTEVEGGYAVQVVTEKGKSLLDGLSLGEIEPTLLEPALRDTTVVPEVEAWPQHFGDGYWARLADRCLSCRLCAYVCPTCRCFDVRDYQHPGGDIQRIRTWDGCMSEGYRRIAGGHNPRPTKVERLRNRFFCKFCYYPQMTGHTPALGPVACVGCGRCIDACPVNVDLVEVLTDVSNLEAARATLALRNV
jgi:ferredoxin